LALTRFTASRIWKKSNSASAVGANHETLPKKTSAPLTHSGDGFALYRSAPTALAFITKRNVVDLTNHSASALELSP